MRKGGFSASVPCAVDVAVAEVPLLSPQLLSAAAVIAAPMSINHLTITVPPMKHSVRLLRLSLLYDRSLVTKT